MVIFILFILLDCQSQIPHIKPPCLQVCRQIWHCVVNLCGINFQVIWGPGKFSLKIMNWGKPPVQTLSVFLPGFILRGLSLALKFLFLMVGFLCHIWWKQINALWHYFDLNVMDPYPATGNGGERCFSTVNWLTLLILSKWTLKCQLVPNVCHASLTLAYKSRLKDNFLFTQSTKKKDWH